jgi:hypothetical protein
LEKLDLLLYLCLIMEQRELEDRIIELEFELKTSRDKEFIYHDILNNINTSLNDLFIREQENNRFHISEDIDYRECLVNLRNSLSEYRRIYRIQF